MRHDLFVHLARKRHERDHESHGLNFKHQIEVYGYAYLPDKFNFEQWTFEMEYMEHNMFVTSYLQKIYSKRWREVAEVSGSFLDLQKMWVIFNEVQRLDEPAFVNLFLSSLNAFILNIFRRYIFQVRRKEWQILRVTFSEEELEQMKDAQRGVLPMDIVYFNLFTKNLSEEERKIASGTGIERKIGLEYSLSAEYRVRWFWDWEESSVETPEWKRLRWENAPYRLLFQTVYKELSLRIGKEMASVWKKKFLHLFLMSHSVLPNCSSERFWQMKSHVWKWIILQNRTIFEVYEELSPIYDYEELNDKFGTDFTRFTCITHDAWRVEGRFLYENTMKYPFHDKTISEIILALRRRVAAYKVFKRRLQSGDQAGRGLTERYDWTLRVEDESAGEEEVWGGDEEEL